MNVVFRRSETYEITGVEGRDLLRATLTDEGPGKGRLQVWEGGVSHSCYWNNMKDRTVREFFLAAGDDYIAGCLDQFATLFRKIDPAVLKSTVITDINESTVFDDEQKIALMGQMVKFDPISDVNGLQALNMDLMVEVYGPMWAHLVNEKFLGRHPLYVGMKERIALIRTALQG